MKKRKLRLKGKRIKEKKQQSIRKLGKVKSYIRMSLKGRIKFDLIGKSLYNIKEVYNLIQEPS